MAVELVVAEPDRVGDRLRTWLGAQGAVTGPPAPVEPAVPGLVPVAPPADPAVVVAVPDPAAARARARAAGLAARPTGDRTVVRPGGVRLVVTGPPAGPPPAPGIVAVEVATPEPEVVAERWAGILGADLTEDRAVALAGAVVRFVHGPRDALVAVDLRAVDDRRRGEQMAVDGAVVRLV